MDYDSGHVGSRITITVLNVSHMHFDYLCRVVSFGGSSKSVLKQGIMGTTVCDVMGKGHIIECVLN